MRVVERINELLKEKNISKKELANRLMNLGMRANKTGEIPTLSSIYAYLNGNIDIKADMLPFIADALGVLEQELFSDKKEENLKIIKKLYQENSHFERFAEFAELLKHLSPTNLEFLEEILLKNKQNALNTQRKVEKFSKILDKKA